MSLLNLFGQSKKKKYWRVKNAPFHLGSFFGDMIVDEKTKRELQSKDKNVRFEPYNPDKRGK